MLRTQLQKFWFPSQLKLGFSKAGAAGQCLAANFCDGCLLLKSCWGLKFPSSSVVYLCPVTSSRARCRRKPKSSGSRSDSDHQQWRSRSCRVKWFEGVLTTFFWKEKFRVQGMVLCWVRWTVLSGLKVSLFTGLVSKKHEIHVSVNESWLSNCMPTMNHLQC